ncbi:MAG TPA: crotonase/enoyl-CoA hydratase family protein [Pseudomonadales bacterium]|jgi:enoyl-CoA hydratase/carnithine racemase|nr:enoyl-CoA hydratase [Gammaproteobacteria bacterium]MDP6027451.1 crotonase/enoyl-CoA hydratase family protein [Pseudomonadales bacterium]MDP6315362.1 crotonase/enoyl-CoA hydratase family protein [Pseudomonadales bacterium]MDP7315417.1 crotonase/enoyl-CoA hydratase family protein [Pseudomonadales bacterium]MDP7576633.1 crotonase/enoyl-CoA hydratase family protein [Pseudomonadales bacterium]|tara:strand:- start:8848 stop:9648 length:801 start_codon:yes stop_codon:yes gene_type:complete
MSDPLLYEHSGAIVTLTLNRHETRNAISEDEMVNAIEDACAKINGDSSVRVAIITGAGSAFSSGGNVKDMRDKKGMFGGTATEIRDGYLNGIQRIPVAIHGLEVPIIAAVNGAAIGAGCDLTMMCDMRIASEKAVFAESFVKVGLIPGDGGAWFLPRVIGLSRANEMAFTGEPVDAQTALAWGLVSRVVPPEELMAAANELAGRIAVNPPSALRMTKRLIKEGEHTQLGSILELSASLQALAHQTRDHAEAVNAIIDKRQPNFTGE